MAGFNLDEYVDVAARIAMFRDKYPNGSLQQHALDFREFGGESWVVFTAAAYRTPEDLRPGHGTAWEPVPGKTPYTRGSELQNAETAAWGRAIVAALAADTKKGGSIASAEEVRNRQAPKTEPQRGSQQPVEWTPTRRALLERLLAAVPDSAKRQEIANQWGDTHGHSINSTDDLDSLAALVALHEAGVAE